MTEQTVHEAHEIESSTKEAPTQSNRQLVRSRTDRWIAGVAGGLAQYLGVDPLIVRLVFVASLFFGGGGIIAYIALALLMPIRTDDESVPASGSGMRNSLFWGTLLILLGMVLLFNNLGWIPVSLNWLWNTFWALFWPLVLIVVGLALLVGIGRRDGWGFRDGIPLRRSQQDRVLAGVCGGIGEYLRVDPVIVRIAWALLTLASWGVGILVYVLAALLLPPANGQQLQAKPS